MNLEQLVLPFDVDTKALIGIAGITAAVAALTGAMAGAISATFKWADELDSLQDITGVSNKTAAALNYTLRKSGVESSKLTKGMTILNKGLVKADGTLDTVGRDLKDFGINIFDTNGVMKDQERLLEEITNRYNSFSTQQERVNFLTKTFGKSGADLVDFFDTLAQSGGLDVVADKVEKLGLAIDPNRYEQFNRNLEELKLIGLGLAVAFTEKVMPILEKFLDILSDPNLTTTEKIKTILKAADDFVGAFIQGIADSINNWINSGGPVQLSLKFTNWIAGIGQDSPGTPNSATITAIENLVRAIVRAIEQVPWDDIGTILHNKFNTQIDKMFTDSDKKNLQVIVGGIGILASAYILGQIAKLTIGIGLLGPILSSIAAGLHIVIALIQTAGYYIAGAIGITMGWLTFWVALIALVIIYRNEINTWGLKFDAWIHSLEIKVNNFWANFGNKAAEAINKAISWFNKLAANLGDNWAIPTIPTGNSSNSTQNPMYVPPGSRASGGPTIAGQVYTWQEYGGGEMFTSTQSGRIDKRDDSVQRMEFDEDRLGTIIGRAVGQELAKRNM